MRISAYHAQSFTEDKKTNPHYTYLPVGGGRNGFVFGSVLPVPAFITTAFNFGQI
jgi:hypothetical protein